MVASIIFWALKYSKYLCWNTALTLIGKCNYELKGLKQVISAMTFHQMCNQQENLTK